MRRHECQMCHYLGDTKFCDYYDMFYMECADVKICPDGLDDEFDEDEGMYEDEEDY